MNAKIQKKIEEELKESYFQRLDGANPALMEVDELVDAIFHSVSEVMTINLMQASQSAYARAVAEMRKGTPTLGAPPKNIIIPGRG